VTCNAPPLGQIGTDWAFVTLGGFNGSDTSDMLLRNSTTGGVEVHAIGNNNLIGDSFLGAVGLDWQVMGFGNFSSFGETDMMMRNANTVSLRHMPHLLWENLAWADVV
jgi:hypothetical protein